MKIVVCIKQIPDPANPYALDPTSHLMVRPHDQILDDTDRYGLELGLQFAAATQGTVTAVSMSPAGGLQGIRQALAMGADAAVVVNDEALRGSSTLATARVLAAAIGRAPVDLVICGTESTDGYAGVVPQQLAELLGLPALTFARKAFLANGSVRIERQTADGYDLAEAKLPALLSVTTAIAEPRYPTFKGIMAAKNKPLTQLLLADLGLDPSLVGLAGSGQQILKAVPTPERTGGHKVVDQGEAHFEIVALLKKAKVI